MNYTIYQIKDIENCGYAFRHYDTAKKIGLKLADYKSVYSGTVKTKEDTYETLEDLFRIFNIDRPEDFKGHSLSVSDIIELEGEYYYCDFIGFEKLNKEEL